MLLLQCDQAEHLKCAEVTAGTKILLKLTEVLLNENKTYIIILLLFSLVILFFLLEIYSACFFSYL